LVTFWLALDLVVVPAGGTIAVTGAAGAGVFADASEDDVPLVRDLGADGSCHGATTSPTASASLRPTAWTP
jgi:hypothetical protein